MHQSDVKLKKLFEPGRLGPIATKNRLVMAPVGSRLPNELGGVSQRMIDYYVERAKGGVGTIVLEASAVDYPLAVASPKNLRIHDDAYIGGHNELTEAVHLHDVKIVCQLLHVGRNRRPADGMQPVGPSAVPCSFFNVVPRELTTEEVEGLVQKFVNAAVRAKTAGYDAVELHGAHGYLISQFMSADSNIRTDRYGGTLKDRMTFPFEIIRGIKSACGPKYPIFFRISGDEFYEGGMDLPTACEIAGMLEAEGIDVLDVSSGAYPSLPTIIEPMSYEEGWKIYLAEAVKKAVKIPVIGVGVIRSPALAERILEEGRADFVAVGRALLADPLWPLKAKENREKDIVPCISCNSCLGDRTSRNLHIRCAVNPLAGREHLAELLAEAETKKTVLVIGGGPAGVMAALTAGDRGHEVILYEESDRPGGQLPMAAGSPGKEKIGWFLDHLLHRLEQNPSIRVKTRTPVTAKEISSRMPDAVVIATGATPIVPDIPGVGGPNVVTAWDVLQGKVAIVGKKVLIAGGGTVGCETALELSPENEHVIVVEMLDRVASDMEAINRMDLIFKMEKAGIEIRLDTKIARIEESRVFVQKEDGPEDALEADVAVMALGSRSRDDLVRELDGKVRELYAIGDCSRPGKIADAVREGFLAGLRI